MRTQRPVGLTSNRHRLEAVISYRRCNTAGSKNLRQPRYAYERINQQTPQRPCIDRIGGRKGSPRQANSPRQKSRPVELKNARHERGNLNTVCSLYAWPIPEGIAGGEALGNQVGKGVAKASAWLTSIGPKISRAVLRIAGQDAETDPS